jgi:hypothetical protein
MYIAVEEIENFHQGPLYEIPCSSGHVRKFLCKNLVTDHFIESHFDQIDHLIEDQTISSKTISI